MTPDQVARRWFHEVWDEGREDAIDRYLAPHALAHGLRGAPLRGPEQFKQFYRMFQEALGDLEVKVERTIVEGDCVAVHCRVVGRHIGNGLGGPPTWRSLEFWGVSILRVQNGQIVEGWNVFDFLTMYQQMGWVSNPPLP
jgi:predicted ester cyclase